MEPINLEKSVESEALDFEENPVNFEGTMITTERYRQTMYDEMGLLNIKTTLLLLEDDRSMSKALANESLMFVSDKLRYVDGNEKNSFMKLKEALESITHDNYKIDLLSAMKEVKSLSKSMKADLREAKANYYKIFKQY